MKPVRTELHGFGPHLDTAVDWSRLGHVAAISAPNGSGKTFLLEGGYAALYGEFPARPGSLYDRMTQGGIGEASVVFEFTERGVQYRAERRLRATGKSQSQEAELCEIVDGESVVIAGPKVRDFEAMVRERFGDGATAMATWLAPQGSRGDLCNALPSERRNVFADLLRFGSLDKRSESFRAAAAKAEAVAETLTAQLEGVPDYDSDERTAMEERGRAATQLAEARRAIATAEERRAILQEAIAELKAAAPEVESLRREHSTLQERIASLEDSATRLEADRAKALVESTGLAEAEAAERDVPAMESGVAALETQDAAHRAHEAWRVENDKLKLSADGKNAAAFNAEHAEERARLGDDERAVIADADNIKAEGDGLKARLDAVRATNAERAKARAKHETAAQVAVSEAKRIQDRIDAKPQTPFGEKCSDSGCRFVAEYAKLPAMLECAKNDAATAREALASVPADEAEPDVAEITRRCEALRNARRRAADHDAALVALGMANKEAREAKEAHDAHNATEPAFAADCAAALKESRSILDAKRRTAQRAAACRMASARAGEIAEAVARTRSEIETVSPNLEAARQRLESAMAGDTERQARLSGHQREFDAIAKELETQRNTADHCTRAAASLDSRIERIAADRAEAERKRGEAAATIAKARDLRLLQEAFGRKGVQPILIDQAAPALEALAAEILERLTEGRMSLRFSTQRALKGGGVSEDFLILACDSRGERDISTFSGGERRILQTTLRIAIMLWIGAMHGRSADCLLVDEGFDALDGENAERMVELLHDLGRRFGSVVVVTHDEHLAGRIGSQLRLNKGAIGVGVEYVGANN